MASNLTPEVATVDAADNATAASEDAVAGLNVADAAWTVCFSVIVAVGTCGNGIVVWIICGRPSAAVVALAPWAYISLFYEPCIVYVCTYVQ